jgi:hypothetical protein
MTVTCSGCGANVDGAVAQSVADQAFANARAEKKRAEELAAQVTELSEKAAELGKITETRDQLAKQLNELEAHKNAWETERSFLQAGLTDAEGLEFARIAYSRLPENERPAIADWLANRDQLPKAVQAYLPASQAQAPTEPQPAPQQKAAAPINPNNGVVPTSNAPENFPPGSISSMSVDAYRQHRDAIIASISGGRK